MRAFSNIAAIAASLLFVPAALAQTAPVPGVPTAASGPLSRSHFFVALAGLQIDDPRFSFAERARADVDLFSYGRGRVNLLVDTELVMGSERRSFDLNQANVMFETSASYRVGPVDLAGVIHHVSRHIVDREFDRVPAWHTIGARAMHVFAVPEGTIDVSVEYGRVVQKTFVDYTWTNQATVRFNRVIGSRLRLFASGRGGFVGVEPAVLGRRRQAGGRAEGGVRFVTERGLVDLYAATEHRVDGYPTSRVPSTWVELGFRLSAP
jgi:hypothetical protein